ncbi:MAG: hypothetical protein ACLRR0_02400 [Subdoligranulum sp.]
MYIFKRQHRTNSALRGLNSAGNCGTGICVAKMLDIDVGCRMSLAEAKKPLASAALPPASFRCFLLALTFCSIQYYALFDGIAPRSPYRHLNYAVLP